ncbi:aldehyde dehydrogenase [Mycobacterium sp. DL592]|uniref:aldehyde dehydrogenase n=1 Tax=Mycobacterium sp. DL592 TaxID=2675524 RepID=UPI0014239B93|nr:aldehyde dehydrogenase [Mycobacterium sp. DL592]
MTIAEPLIYVGGNFRPPGQLTTIIEPATGAPLGQGPCGTEADIDDAVSAAQSASAQQWRASSPAERAAVLKRFSAPLRERSPQTAVLVTRENGMPITLSRVVNGVFPPALIRYYAGIVGDSSPEEVRPAMAGDTLVCTEPVGVVAAITPWNYPQAIAVMKIAPALAAGCSVVLKAAPETSLDALAFAHAAADAGLPDGVLNVVPGGAAAGAHLVGHPGVDKVAFTGSTGAGRAIGETCGRLIRPVTLELGGKSAAIILDDADLTATLNGLRSASFVNNGQTCHLSSRILAPRSRYAEFVDAIADLADSLTVGDPLDESTDIGPMVSARQRERVLDYIGIGRDSGARLVAGGGIPSDQPVGWFVEPTVFADVDNSDRIAQEEIFGPVVTITPYDDDEDAVRLANDSAFGLAGTVWSPDAERATAVARKIRTGSIGINGYELDMRSPFGGVKDSGIGRELGPEGLSAYQVSKSIYRF